MLKVLHTADWHIKDSALEECNRCLAAMVIRAQREEPDLVVIAGDIFDSRNVKVDSGSARLAFEVVSNLAEEAPVAIALGTPSHDGKAATVLRHVRARHNVMVASAPQQAMLHKNGRLSMSYSGEDLNSIKAVVSIVPQPTKQFFEVGEGEIKRTDAEIAQEMSNVFAGFGALAKSFPVPHVLIGHWNTTGAYISDNQILTGVDIEIHPDQMALACADVVTLGHIHKQQQINKNIFYPGSIYSNTWGEMDPKGFYIHHVDKGALESEFVETPSTKRVKFSHDLVAAPTESILPGLNGQDLADATVRYDITVYQDEADQLEVEAIEKRFTEAGAKDVEVRILRVPRENVRSKKLLKLATLRDKLIERASLADETVPEPTLEKADLLESQDPDQIAQAVAAL